jgi:GT2 family glycosyltransferase
MKVSIIVLIYNARKYIEPLFDSVFSQTYKNFEVVAVINGSNDGSRELIAQKYPQVKIIDPQANLWFSKGNNLGIQQSSGELIYCVNQDVVLEPDNLENLVEAFKDEKVGAATGKVLRYDFVNNKKTKIIDSTGIIMSKSGRGRDRAQNESDNGQFDKFKIQDLKSEIVFGISGAVAMYRRSALEIVKYCSPVIATPNLIRGKPSNCLIIHGCPSRQEDLIDIRRMNAKHWIPWLAENLKRENLDVYTPIMPTPWAPVYEIWKKEFEKLPVNENSILVGHSCACPFLVRWLGETKRPIKKLVLVAPAKITKETHSEEIRKLYSFEIDESIRNRVSEIVILLGENDSDRVKSSAKIFSSALNSSIRVMKNYGHFTFEDMGTTEFPELLKEILRTDNGQVCEYFDEDLFAYWEDVDLSWRLNRAGFVNVYVPSAVSYHGRTAGSSRGGYLKIFQFIKHHRSISPQIRRLNYKNHILIYIKNAPFIHPLFILREIVMLGYIILFEISTLKVLPELFHQIPKILKKRKAQNVY